MANSRKFRRCFWIFLPCLFLAALIYGFSEQFSVIWHRLLLKEPFNVSECLEYSDDSFASAQVLSKELVVRRVYFDPRGRDGYPNTIVFLLEAKGLSLNGYHFYGCQVGCSFSDNFYFRPPRNYEWVQKNEHTKSTLALIDCYNIPKVRSGDLAALYYKSSAGAIVNVLSQKPLFAPEPRAAVKSSTIMAAVCVGVVYAAEHSAADHWMLYHWLRYQKVIGVDHVHMFVENSFVRAGGLQNEVMQEAIRDGYLSIDFWPQWLNASEVFNTQKIAYQDCIHRFQHVYDYIIHIDSDDFFVPLKSKSIKDYLLKWCGGKVATCRFEWHQFFPDCGWDPKAIGADGNFTAAMTYKHTWKRIQTKSGHQLRAILDAGTHQAMVLFDGYRQKDVPSKEAYFAHIRFGWVPKKGC